jgi:ribonuclease-3
MVRVGGHVYGTGEGRSKKEAEQQAAEAAWNAINDGEPPLAGNHHGDASGTAPVGSAPAGSAPAGSAPAGSAPQAGSGDAGPSAAPHGAGEAEADGNSGASGPTG